MFVKSIGNVLVDTLGSFRVFIVASYVLCQYVTSETFCFCNFVPIRTNDTVVVVYEAATIAGYMDWL
jgi:hypothetical protein